MAARRVNPNRVKLHRSYSVPELADCCDVHKNTVRNWQLGGLEPIDKSRPVLFLGHAVRAFLTRCNASRKRPCPPGTIYCFRCREPRKPALGMVEYVPITTTTGNLRAMCEACEAIMHRRTRLVDLAKVMPGFTVQITQGQPRLIGRTAPSLNCDFERN
ncbi:MAG: helix-turn-helix domain-containing protein [Novosphingobium sp.]